MLFQSQVPALFNQIGLELYNSATSTRKADAANTLARNCLDDSSPLCKAALGGESPYDGCQWRPGHRPWRFQ